MTRDFRWWFYNAAPATHDRRTQLPAELRAMAASKPLVIGLVEAIGYDLPKLPGYVLLRDTTRPGRANVAAYVRVRWPGRAPKPRWVDCHETWPRTDHPGTHPPRSILWFEHRGVRWVIGHAPPVTHGMTSKPARLEHFRKVLRLTNTDRSVVILGDWNAVGDEPVSAWSFSRGKGFVTSAGGIDAAVAIRATLHDVRYPDTINGTHLHTDHRGALGGVVRVSKEKR